MDPTTSLSPPCGHADRPDVVCADQWDTSRQTAHSMSDGMAGRSDLRVVLSAPLPRPTTSHPSSSIVAGIASSVRPPRRPALRAPRTRPLAWMALSGTACAPLPRSCLRLRRPTALATAWAARRSDDGVRKAPTRHGSRAAGMRWRRRQRIPAAFGRGPREQHLHGPRHARMHATHHLCRTEGRLLTCRGARAGALRGSGAPADCRVPTPPPVPSKAIPLCRRNPRRTVGGTRHMLPTPHNRSSSARHQAALPITSCAPSRRAMARQAATFMPHCLHVFGAPRRTAQPGRRPSPQLTRRA